MESKENNRNQTVDVIRILACYMVIYCHVELPGSAKAYSMGLARFAVPYFLMVTGWFLWKEKLEEEDKAVRRHLVSMCKLFAISAPAISIVNIFVCRLKGDPLFSWLTKYWSGNHAIFEFFMYNRASFFSSVVYYLPLMIYVAIIYLLLLRKGWIRFLYYLIIPLISMNIYRGEVIGLRWYYQGNWLFTGLPFVAIGRLLHEKKLEEFVARRTAYTLIVVGICITLLEAGRFEGRFIYVGTVPLALGIFMLAINGRCYKWPSWIVDHGRYITPIIFLSHCSIRDLCYTLAGEPQGLLRYFMPTIIFLFSSAFAILLLELKRLLWREESPEHPGGGKLRGLMQRMKEYQFMFEELVKRDFKKKYKRTVLGMGWSVLSPLLTLLVMRLVFTRFFGRDMAHYTTYLFAGNLMFSYFKEQTSGGMYSLMSNAQIFTKINVPKYMFLITKCVSAVINFALTLVVFFIFVAIDKVPFQPTMFAVVYPIITLTMFNVGVGMVLSALYVFFRDTQYLYDVFTLLLMYVSAIFYTVDNFPVWVQRVFLVNPVFCNIKYVRVVVLDGNLPSLPYHMLLLLYGVGALLIGGIVYKKYNQRFLYYV